MKLTREQFVRLWQGAESVADLVSATGLTRMAIHTRAARLRKAGVQLKVMPHRPRKQISQSEVDRLNIIVREVGQ